MLNVTGPDVKWRMSVDQSPREKMLITKSLSAQGGAMALLISVSEELQQIKRLEDELEAKLEKPLEDAKEGKVITKHEVMIAKYHHKRMLELYDYPWWNCWYKATDSSRQLVAKARLALPLIDEYEFRTGSLNYNQCLIIRGI
jgi:hypothetical protein